MKLIHISDLHLVSEGTLFGLDPALRFAAAIDSINAEHGDAELVIISGDLADEGEAAAYALLKRMLAELRVPWRLMLGNHDRRANFYGVFPDYVRDDNGFVQEAVDHAGIRLVLIDTLSEPDAGELCERRIAWIAARLEEARDIPVYLFMHHPPFSIGHLMMDRHMLRNAGPFAALVAEHPQIRHLFFGHIHRPLGGSWQRIPISALPAINHQVALDFRDLPGISGHDGDGAYNVVFIEPDRTIVHLHDFMTPHRAFDLDDPVAQRA